METDKHHVKKDTYRHHHDPLHGHSAAQGGQRQGT